VQTQPRVKSQRVFERLPGSAPSAGNAVAPRRTVAVPVAFRPGAAKRGAMIRRLQSIAAAILALASGSSLVCADAPPLTAPDALLKRVEQSHLIFQVSPFETGVSDEAASAVELGDRFFIEETRGTITLREYQLRPGVQRLFDEGEEYFKFKAYAEAITSWRAALQLDPSCHFLETMIGDAHFARGDYPQAKKSFQEAIAANRIDYQAHWFLADTYARLGEGDRVVDSLLRAHLYNRHNPRILSRLKQALAESGQTWLEWDFVPLYQLTKTGDTIGVRAKEEWVGYALAKAVWKFEPDYPDHGPKEETLLNARQEKEAVLMYLAQAKEEARVHGIVAAGFFNEFSLYETAIRKWPQTARLLPAEDVERLVEYLKRFHVAPAPGALLPSVPAAK